MAMKAGQLRKIFILAVDKGLGNWVVSVSILWSCIEMMVPQRKGLFNFYKIIVKFYGLRKVGLDLFPLGCSCLSAGMGAHVCIIRKLAPWRA